MMLRNNKKTINSGVITRKLARKRKHSTDKSPEENSIMEDKLDNVNQNAQISLPSTSGNNNFVNHGNVKGNRSNTSKFSETVKNSSGKGLDKSNISFSDTTCDGTIYNSDEETDPYSTDDSVNDPNYTPNEKDNTLSDFETSDIEVIAEAIENNILDTPDNSLISSSSTTSAIDNSSNLGRVVIKGKHKKSMVREKSCKQLEKCKMDCKEKITYEQQKSIFHSYWSLRSYESKLFFISSLLEIVSVKRRTTLNKTASRNREHSYKYYLNINGSRLQVCQKCFKYTLGETDSVLKTAAKKTLTQCLHDKRGSKTPNNKLSSDKIQEVLRHINQFPAYESHYSRQRTSKKYLQSDLTKSHMYKLYTESHENLVSLSKYCEIFKETGISIKKPKNDTCSKCDGFKMQLDLAKSEEEVNEVKRIQSEHHSQAELAYGSKNKDKEMAKSNPQIKLYTFDLEQCLPTPYLRSNVSFYKRQLWTYNLTVHDCVLNTPFCYMWHEAMAKRGANEIASCLLQHLLNEPATTEQIVLYSDCCVGQNKNSFVAMMFTLFMQESHNIRTIDHKFLVPGHTHMECDVDHSIIERKKKKTTIQIHHPREWYQFIRSVGNNQAFNVIEMSESKMFDFEKLLKTKCMWRNTSRDKIKFKWSDVKWLRYTKRFGIIQFKNTLDEDEPFMELNICKRGISGLKISNLQLAHENPPKISVEKKKDLVDQLHLIDKAYHSFYLQLNEDNIPNIDPDICSESDESDTE